MPPAQRVTSAWRSSSSPSPGLPWGRRGSPARSAAPPPHGPGICEPEPNQPELALVRDFRVARLPDASIRFGFGSLLRHGVTTVVEMGGRLFDGGETI